MRPESRDAASLWDMAMSMRQIRTYLAGITWEDFRSDVGLQDKVNWRLVLVGEAATRLSEGIRIENPELPWSSIVGLRNVVIHQYDNIDLQQVWKAASVSVPTVLPVLECLLESLGHPLPPEELN